MKKKSPKKIVLFFIVLSIMFNTKTEYVMASEVINDVGITFTKENKAPTDPVKPIDPKEDNGSSDLQSIINEEKLPQTGVRVRNRIVIGWIIGMILVGLVYLKKRLSKI